MSSFARTLPDRLRDEFRKVRRFYVVAVSRSRTKQRVQYKSPVLFNGSFLRYEVEEGIEHGEPHPRVIQQHQGSRIEANNQSNGPNVQKYWDCDDYQSSDSRDRDLRVTWSWKRLACGVRSRQRRRGNDLSKVMQDFWRHAHSKRYRRRNHEENRNRRGNQSNLALLFPFTPQDPGGLGSELCYFGVEIRPQLPDIIIYCAGSIFEFECLLIEGVRCSCKLHLRFSDSLCSLSIKNLVFIENLHLFRSDAIKFLNPRGSVPFEYLELRLDYRMDGLRAGTHCSPTDETNELVFRMGRIYSFTIPQVQAVGSQDRVYISIKVDRHFGRKFFEFLVRELKVKWCPSFSYFLQVALSSSIRRCNYILHKECSAFRKCFLRDSSESLMGCYTLLDTGFFTGGPKNKQSFHKKIFLIVHFVRPTSLLIVNQGTVALMLTAQPCAELARTRWKP